MGTDSEENKSTTVVPLHKTDHRKERTEACHEVLGFAKEWIDENGGADEVLIWIRSGHQFRRFNSPVDDVIGLIGRIEMHKDDLMQWMKDNA